MSDLHKDIDHVLLDGSMSKNGLLKKSSVDGIVVFRPLSEEMFRFALEKSSVDIVLGVEYLHRKDSVHYLRGGLDPVLCKIAVLKGKTIGFSFSDILNSSDRSRLLARMMFNIRLCRKFGVKMYFGCFGSSDERRSVKDLEAFWRVLGGNKREIFK